ncbi:MAG: RimK family alpha-L-glutamate ligase [Bacteroidales bacterium]
MKMAILRNEDPDSAAKWAVACKKFGVNYTIINLTQSDWFERFTESSFDFCLVKPPGLLSHFKTLFDERLFIIAKVLGKPVYPSYEEVIIYENKKFLSYFLKANKIPHPATFVYYHKSEAMGFIEVCKYPLVAKTSIGASGSGVAFLKDKNSARKYINKAFSKGGIKRRFGPNRVTGSPKIWAEKTLRSPEYFIKKLKKYFNIYAHGERGFVIFQEFIPHDFEWRAVKIGESYFAHKKIKTGDKASGSKGIEYVNPSPEILDFTRLLCEANNFNFMAIDFFEDGNGGFLVNELQTIFGHVQDHILEMDGNPGRFLYKDNQWVFERGNFNTNESYDLRLETAINLYKRGL